MAFVRPPDTPGRDAEAFATVTANKENDVAWRREADSKKDDDSNAAATAATAADEEKTAAEVSAYEAHVAESSPSSSAERVRRAEERYHRARERLRMAASVSVSDSSAEASSRARRPRGERTRNDDGACPSDAATASWSTTRAGGESVSGRAGDSPRESASMLEMAAKVDAALARSRLAQERIQAAAGGCSRGERGGGEGTGGLG